jgi:thioredoxin 1
VRSWDYSSLTLEKEVVMGTAKEFTTGNWKKEVLGSEKPVLVDFWAPWCGPCRMQGPIVEQLAVEVGESAVVGKLNTDENPEVAGHYGIMSIPTLMVFKGGKPVKQFVGVTNMKTLKSTLQTVAA